MPIRSQCCAVSRYLNPFFCFQVSGAVTSPTSPTATDRRGLWVAVEGSIVKYSHTDLSSASPNMLSLGLKSERKGVVVGLHTLNLLLVWANGLNSTSTASSNIFLFLRFTVSWWALLPQVRDCAMFSSFAMKLGL